MRSDYKGIVCPSLDFQTTKLEVAFNIISAYQIISPNSQPISTFILQISVICGRNGES